MSARPIHDDHTDTAEVEAAAWVIRFADVDVPDDVRASFRDWLDQDPSHAAAYDDAERTWRELGRIGQAGRRPRSRVMLPVIALLIVLVALWQDDLRIGLRADHVARVGENLSLTLADGSRVDLSSGSAIRVEFGAETRLVHLLRGKAFFAPEPAAAAGGRAFVVEAGETRSTALGTQFSVDMHDDRVEVVVAEHRVRVEQLTGTAQPIVVEQGMGVEVDAGPIRMPETRDLQFANSWRSGELIFSDRPLVEVVEELNRYRHGKILLRGSALGHRRVSGVFHARDIRDAEARLASELGLRRLSLPFVTVLF